MTLALLVAGYTVGRVSALGRAARYFETIFLSLMVFLLLVPSVIETLTRLPIGNPIAKGPDSPILLGALGTLVVLLVVGLTAQILHLRRSGTKATAVPY